MPGIFGVLGCVRDDQRTSDTELMVRQMAGAMAYESWHETQVVSCPVLGVWGGRVGLPDGGSARWPTGRRPAVLAVVAGEPSLEATLQPDVPADTEGFGPGVHQVTSAYLRDGEAGLAALRGNFAGLVIDTRNGRSVLFTDKYGRERLFLHAQDDRLLFASEAKAILAVTPGTRTFDPVGLAEFLTCGCTLGPRSLFRDIEIVEGGTLIIGSGEHCPNRRKYFDRAAREQMNHVAAGEFREGFAASLRDAARAGIATAPTAMSLTAGLDSRMVMAVLDPPALTLPCYTFGSMYRTTADVAVARRVAATCGQTHNVLELGEDFLSGIWRTLDEAVYISDGYMGLSGAAELYLSRIARSIAPARMTGNWGGELMRGVRAFKSVTPGDFVADASLRQLTDESAASFRGTTAVDPLSFALHYQLPFQGYGRYTLERSQLRTLSPFLSDGVVEWLYRASEGDRGARESFSAVIGRRADLLTIPTDTGELGTGPEVVRAGRRAYRKAIAKAEYLTSHGAPHWMASLSSSLPSPLLERRFLGRDKFQHFRVWLRTRLAEGALETLAPGRSPSLDAWFDMRKVAAMVSAHVSGRANHTDDIDKLLTIAAADRTLFSAAVRPTSEPVTYTCA